jgi:hypothetical protein
MQPESTEPTIEILEKKAISKTDIITATCVFLLAVFIIALFLMSKIKWQQELEMANKATAKTDIKVEAKSQKPEPANENAIVIDNALLEAEKADEQETKKSKAIGNEQDTEELEAENEKLKQENKAFRTADSVRMQGFLAMASYKIYGLYRDKSGKQTEKEIAKKFYIKSEKAIKIAEINGEKAFVVPVKGIHIAKSGDTAFSIAKKYYKNDKQAQLITDFNGEIQAGQTVFLPFVAN